MAGPVLKSPRRTRLGYFSTSSSSLVTSKCCIRSKVPKGSGPTARMKYNNNTQGRCTVKLNIPMLTILSQMDPNFQNCDQLLLCTVSMGFAYILHICTHSTNKHTHTDTHDLQTKCIHGKVTYTIYFMHTCKVI